MSDGTNRINNHRPFKMGNWIVALKEVLNDEDITFLSDKDMVFLVNAKLPKKEKIGDATFERWKAGKFAPDEKTGEEFIECIKFSLIKQKQNLGKKLQDDTSGQWTRYAWILERKFADWNLKHVSENINKNETETVINITAGNDTQRKLIDDIINAEFAEVKPKQLSTNDNNDDNELPF